MTQIVGYDLYLRVKLGLLPLVLGFAWVLAPLEVFARPAQPFDLCVFINGGATPEFNYAEFYDWIDTARTGIEGSAGCKDVLIFTASGDPKARDMTRQVRDAQGFTIVETPPFGGLPATKAALRKAFAEKAVGLKSLGRGSRTFIFFGDHGNGSGHSGPRNV